MYRHITIYKWQMANGKWQVTSSKLQVTSYKFVNCKPNFVIARSEMTCLRVMHRQAKLSKFTLVGLLHFVRNDTVVLYYSPSLQFPPNCGGNDTIWYIFPNISSSPLTGYYRTSLRNFKKHFYWYNIINLAYKNRTQIKQVFIINMF